MKLSNKAQALVEFVIILPVIIMIIFIIIDFSNIFYQKNHLENVTKDIVTYKESGKSNEYVNQNIDKDINVLYSNNGDSLTIKVEKKVKLITPFSGLFFENPYRIKTERTILNE